MAQSTKTDGDRTLAGYKFLIPMVRTGITQIFVVDPDTGDAINLSRSREFEDRYPCWSPDGRRIAFASNRAGGANLFIMNADGSDIRPVFATKAVCYLPSWVGERIIFGMHGEKAEMASIKPDGDGLTMLGAGHDPCVSPDGRQVAYTGDAPGGYVPCVMDADGRNRRQLMAEVNTWGAVMPGWSPDGRRIVFTHKVGQALELFIVDADGRNLRQLTHLGRISTPAAWSGDGKWISFRHTDEAFWLDPVRGKQVHAEKPADKRPVWVIRADGTDAHVVEALRYQCAMDGSRAAWKPR